MSARYLTACPAVLVLLVAGLLPRAVSGPPPCPGEEAKQHHARAKLVERVYQVADLVVHLDEEEAPVLTRAAAAEGAAGEWQLRKGRSAPPAPRTHEDRLIKLITRTVAPETWTEAGGRATLDYFPLGMALVIRQTPAAHEQISELLAALRRLQDVEVTAEVRFITVSEACFKRLGLGGAAGAKEGAGQGAPSPNTGCFPRLVFLDDSQVSRFIDAIQADAGTNVVQAPKLTVANGQASAIDLTERQFFVTGVDLVRKDGQVLASPRNEPAATGLKLSLRPVVSPERRCVHLGLTVCLTSLVSPEVPVFPVTVPLTPQAEQGSAAEPVMFTQFVQQPHFTRLAIRRLLTIPDGKSALLSGWSRLREVRDESGPPILSDVPYLNRLFKNVGRHCETEHVMVMVTPRIVVTSAVEEKARAAPEMKPASAPCPEAQEAPSCPVGKHVAELVEKYHRACAEGRLPEATQLAVRALALDPACFNKHQGAAERVKPCCTGGR